MLEARQISKWHTVAGQRVSTLDDISLSVNESEMHAIIGPSGSGKSTLLNLLGLLDRPSTGHIRLDGQDLTHATADDLADLRRTRIGFVFQSFLLLPRMNVEENIALPLVYRGVGYSSALKEALKWLALVGLDHRRGYRPDQLSGGQKQRAAIARALVGSPSIVLADEPSGNLDSGSAEEIMNLFLSLNRDLGVAIVLITHDPSLAQRCHLIHQLRDGKLS